jgi:glycosyltransferase involved in cell wall biosynthesis
MRILQILHDRERGGVEKLSNMIEHGLSSPRFAFETDYLYPRPGLSVLAKLPHVLRLAHRIWRGGFDTLISYQSTASVLVGAIGALSGARLRVVHQTCARLETPRSVRMLDRLVGTLGLYSANIIGSAATWAEFARYPLRYRRAMVLIERGLDAPTPRASREETRRRFDLPLNKSVLLNVGRLAEQKNQDLLIRALACLPQAHLVLAGAGQRMDSYHTLAVMLGVEDRLHMLGALTPEDVADLYGAADLLVFPSTWEAFGLAAAEAAMVGLPMVVADLAVLHEVLRADGTHPVTFVPAHDVEGWIMAISAALDSPPPPHIKAAFARAMCRKYSKQRMIESYLSLFEAPTQTEGNAIAGLRPVEEARS